MARVCILSSVHLALDNRVFYREARSLQRAGHDVVLIAVHGRDEIKDGIHIRGLPRVPRKRRPLLWRKLLRMARDESADVYHFHDPELLLVTPWLRWQTGRPTIYDVHEVYADFIKVKDYMPAWLRYPIAWNFRWLEPLLARLQSALIFADDEIAKTFHAFSGPKTTLFNFPAVSFVEQAVAATRPLQPRSPAAPAEAPAVPPAVAPAVLYLGGMERNRGTALMIEAFAAVHRRRPDARLWLVGHFAPPTLEAEVAAHADRCGVGDVVTITGRVPFTDIGSYLARAAVGWVPWQPARKNHKNIPTKLFEYMSHGLPIVASDLASTRPFVTHGGNGLLVPATRPDAHAEAILRILDDSSGAAAMGRAGQRLVAERYNWARMERRLLDLYDSLVGS